MSAIVLMFEHSLALPFFGIGMKTDLFQFCGQCWDIGVVLGTPDTVSFLKQFWSQVLYKSTVIATSLPSIVYVYKF